MLNRLVAKWMFWVAQGFLPLGRPGARMAHRLLVVAQWFDPKLDRARGWQYLIEGSRAREQGRPEDAVQLLRDASVLLPDNDAVIANLGITLATAGRHEQAIEVLERAMRGEMDLTGEPGVWVALAWSYLRTGRAPKALDACERAVHSGADSLDLRLIHGLAQGVRRGFIARDEFSRLLRARPRMMPMVLEFAQHLAVGGSRDLARQIVRALPAPFRVRAFGIIARSCLNLGDTGTATWAVRELEAYDEPGPLAHLIRAGVALREGKTTTAVREAQRARERDARAAEGPEMLARIHLIRGEGAAATQAAQEALARRSTDALAGALVALDLLERGALHEARQVFMTERSGDALACAYGYATQGLINALHGEAARALALAGDALERWEDVPEWAASAPVRARLVVALKRTVEVLEETPDAAAGEDIARVKEGVEALEAGGR